MGVTQTRMADLVDKSQQSWANYESGRNTPPLSVLQDIVRVSGVDGGWLLTGSHDGSDSEPAEEAALKAGDIIDLREKAITIPLLASYLGAGPGGWAEDSDDALILAGPHLREWMRQEAGVDPSRAFLAEIRGRSMEDWAHDGDLVIGERCSSVQHDDIYAVAYKEELLIKHCLRRGATLTLRSENSMYDDIVVDSDNDLRVIGRIVRRIVA